MARLGRRQQQQLFQRQSNRFNILRRFLPSPFSSKKAFRVILTALAFIAFLPPVFFHFRLRRFHQVQMNKCGWLNESPLVCAHGGDSTHAFPNTMAAYRLALRAQVDCVEIDVSRSLDGGLFALHDRDLQRITGNTTSKVGHLSTKEIKELDALHQSVQKSHDQVISTIEDALTFVSKSVQKIILDVKVGPPSYEKGLAQDILSVVERTKCQNCVVWAKSDNLVRDVIKLSPNATVGYIVMFDQSTGLRTSLLRIKKARVVGVYHPLIDKKLVTILHGRNKKIYAWTVDDVDFMQKMLYERVDGVVTSNPTRLQQLMHDIRIQCLEEGFSLTR